MEELAALLLVLAIVFAVIIFVGAALVWGIQFACLMVCLVAVNILALFEKALCWTSLIPPVWHWALSGFLLGAILHFAIREAPKTNRPRLGASFLSVAVVVCTLSILAHWGSGDPLRFAFKNAPPSTGVAVPLPQTARSPDPVVRIPQPTVTGAEPIPEKKVLWSYNNGEKPASVGSVDEEGNIYVATQNHLTKLSNAGKLLWDLPKPQQGFTVPVICDRYVFSGGKEFVAQLRADGSAAWGKALSPATSAAAPFGSPAVSASDTLLFAGGDEIFAYRLNGGLIWLGAGVRSEDEASPTVRLGSMPLAFGNRVCVFDLNQSLGALSMASGQLTWTYKIEAGAPAGPLAGAGSRLFVVCGRGIYCVNSLTGKQEWAVVKSHTLNPDVVVNANNEVLFGAFDRLYVCRVENGSELTTLPLFHEGTEILTLKALALGSGNLVYVGGNFGVQCIDRASGGIRWRSRVEKVGVNGLTVCYDGNLLARGEDGWYLLPGDSNKGPEHPWSMLYGNPGHTGAAQENRSSSRATRRPDAEGDPSR